MYVCVLSSIWYRENRAQDLHHAVGLGGWEGKVKDPEENKEEGWGNLEATGTTELTTITTSEEQDANCDKGLDAEDDDGEGESSLFYLRE